MVTAQERLLAFRAFMFDIGHSLPVATRPAPQAGRLCYFGLAINRHLFSDMGGRGIRYLPQLSHQEF